MADAAGDKLAGPHAPPGARQRRYQARIRAHVDQHGLVPPAGTNDTAALAAAHAAAVAAGGGVVRIPASCIVTASLTPASNVEIRGSRSGVATVYMASTTATPFAFLQGVYSTGAPLTHFKLADLTIDGLYMQTVFNVGNKGAYLQYLASCVFENLVIQNTLATGLGIDFLTKGTVIRSVKALNCGAGSWAGSQGGGSAGIGIGTGGFSLEHFTIEGCHADGNGTFGIFLEGQGGTTTPGMRIVGCTATNNQLSGFCDAGGAGAQWIGCWAYGNVLDGFTNASGTLVASVPGNDTVWSSCIANNNGRFGFSYYPFRFGNSSNFQANATARVTWSDCKAYSNANQGFYVQTNTGNTIDGLMFTDCEAYQNGSTGLHDLPAWRRDQPPDRPGVRDKEPSHAQALPAHHPPGQIIGYVNGRPVRTIAGGSAPVGDPAAPPAAPAAPVTPPAGPVTPAARRTRGSRVRVGRQDRVPARARAEAHHGRPRRRRQGPHHRQGAGRRRSAAAAAQGPRPRQGRHPATPPNSSSSSPARTPPSPSCAATTPSSSRCTPSAPSRSPGRRSSATASSTTSTSPRPTTPSRSRRRSPSTSRSTPN
jgi:hypothetical protein